MVLASGETPAGPDFSRYLLVCGLLLVGIVGLGLLTRRVLGRSLQMRAAKRSLQVTDVLPLGGKQRLLVVRCFDRSFLIGQGDKELSKIAELDELELESMKRLVAEPTQETFAATLAAQAAPSTGTVSAAPPEKPAPKRRRKRPTLQNGNGVVG